MAECASDFAGSVFISPNIGHRVSPYVPVAFSNLISRFAWSEPFFRPELGQTQIVSAVFAANVDWTLQIVNAIGNPVRNVTGSGNSMQFAWKGTGDGETNLPAGIYKYNLSAQTNGQSSFAFEQSVDSNLLLIANAMAQAGTEPGINWYPKH